MAFTIKKPIALRDPNNGYMVKNRRSQKVQNPNLEKNLVSVTLKRVADDPLLVGQEGRFVIVVSVFSTHKEGLKANVEVDPGKCGTEAQVYYSVEVAAGAAAEHLAEMYGDNLDPDWCAKQAKELFIDVMKKYVELLRQGKKLVAAPS